MKNRNPESRSQNPEIRTRDLKETIRNRGIVFRTNSRYSIFWLLTPIFCFLILTTGYWLLATAFADRVYIDVNSPGMKKLPIAVQVFPGAKEISDTLKEDLTFTGLFDCIDDSAQIERPEQPFNQNNWNGLGVELVVKGSANISGRSVTVMVSVNDVAAGIEVLKKEYSSAPDMTRLIPHSIANDVYKILTGQQGIFRTKIAFTGEKSGNKELHIMDWDGHRINGTGITGGILLTPHWSTSRMELLYSAERQRQWGIYIFDMNTMKEKKIVILNGLNVAGNFFPNGKEFVFTSSKDGKSNIYKGDIVSLKGNKLISSPWIDISPAVSPDGNNILFVSDRAGTPQIYISDREGYGIRRLTFEGNYNTSPAWSPATDRIAYVGRTGGKNQVFLMKSDGTGLTQLTTIGNNEEPSFSPDGRYIAFTSDRDGKKGIYIMRADGEGQKRITPKGFKATNPGWSPI